VPPVTDTHRPGQEGFGLIEVIVSALLIALVSLGVYMGIDGASATSGINKHRSVATELAQQDQDRMRAMAVNELSNYRDLTTQTVGGVLYKISSRATWVADATSTANCTSATAKANYLSVTSQVTWDNMTVAPITVEGLIAPPNGSFGPGQGSLAVQVRDRNGAGVSGVNATLTGPKGYTDATNSLGCVLWGYLPVGNYNVALTKPGYVDPSGAATPSKPAGVLGESTTTLAFDYDLGGRITANYQTLNGATVVPANGLQFTATNANLTVPLAPIGDGAPHTSFTSNLVYPFTVGYAVYAGNCAGAAPTAWGQPAQTALVLPGATTAVNVRMPPINFKVVNGALAVNGATVKLTATATGCSGTVARTTDATGFITDVAFPYGTYTFCAQGVVGTATVRKTVTTAGTSTLTNSSPTGIAAANATVDLASGTTAGACP